MPDHGSNQAKDSKMQAQCPLKTASPSSSSAFSCRTASCRHPLSQQPYPTCRTEHTPLLYIKNTNAPLVTSRRGTSQYAHHIGQKAGESILWLLSGRLADLLHVKAQ